VEKKEENMTTKKHAKTDRFVLIEIFQKSTILQPVSHLKYCQNCLFKWPQWRNV